MDNILMHPNFVARLKSNYEPNQDGVLKLVDKKIRLIIYLLNKIQGLHTLWSCSGHMEPREKPYILMVTDNNGYKKLAEIYADFTNRINHPDKYQIQLSIAIRTMPIYFDDVCYMVEYNSVTLEGLDCLPKRFQDNLLKSLMYYAFKHKLDINYVEMLRVLRLR